MSQNEEGSREKDERRGETGEDRRNRRKKTHAGGEKSQAGGEKTHRNISWSHQPGLVSEDGKYRYEVLHFLGCSVYAL
tara:strand:+ start:295 stop:528 length:234 start_codon:yes stop_codon:yes gene_type:complete